MISEQKSKLYCCEDISLIENYDKAINSTEKWECHHKMGINKSKQELKDNGLYYNRPAIELIFLKQSEHRALHNSLLKSGKTPWNKGKTNIYSEAHKGLTSPTKGKKYNRCKCLTSDGQIKIMPINVIHRYNWEIIKED